MIRSVLMGMSLFTVAAVAQPSKEQLRRQFGDNVTVKSVATRYDFSALSREIPMPFERFQYLPGEQPAGYKVSTTMKPATAAVRKLSTSWATVLPQFGTPSQTILQAYSGKEGGVILYVRWKSPLPADARRAICRVLYANDEKPLGSDTKDDLFVTNDWVMIWSFANPLSELKQAHQKRTFEIVNQEAQRWMDANPDKAKKYLQPKK